MSSKAKRNGPKLESLSPERLLQNPEASSRVQTEPTAGQAALSYRLPTQPFSNKLDEHIVRIKKKQVEAAANQLHRKINLVQQEIGKLAHSNSEERIANSKVLRKIIEREKQSLAKQHISRWEKQAREISRKKQDMLKQLKEREQALLKLKAESEEAMQQMEESRFSQNCSRNNAQQRQQIIEPLNDDGYEREENMHSRQDSSMKEKGEIVQPLPPNGSRNNYQAIKEHERKYLDYLNKNWPMRRRQDSNLEQKEGFSLKAIQEQEERREKREKARKILQRRQQYSEKILKHVHKMALHSPKEESVDWRVKKDQQQHPAKYFKLQKMKKLSMKEIFEMDHQAEVVEQEIVKQKGNEYLRELREKLKSMPHSKSNKERSVQEESFSISSRFTNYLPSLNLEKMKKARQAKPKLEQVTEKALSLEQQMLKKIQKYVDFRKQGIGYLQRGGYEQQCDDSMIKAIRAKIAAAELL